MAAKRSSTPSKVFLTRDAFISRASYLKREPMVIDGVGTIGVRELSGQQLLEYNERVNAMKDKNPTLDTSTSMELMSMLVVMSVCDEDGNLLFNMDDVEQIKQISFDTQITIATKALELSGLAKEAVTEAKESLKKAVTDSSS